MIYMQVTKKQVDNFRQGKLTPCCQVKAQVLERENVQSLKYQVSLQGAKYPYDICIIDLPIIEGTYNNLNVCLLAICNNINSLPTVTRPPAAYHVSDSNSAGSRLSSRHLPSLLQQLLKHATLWREIATPLGFEQGELNNIQSNPILLPGSPVSWLTTMLCQWLEWAPGDGRGSANFATFEELKRGLRQANLGRTSHDLRINFS